MMIYPTEHGMTTAALVARIRHIGDHAADLCRAIEGPNEWNNSRSGGTPMTPAQTVAVQRTIYQAVRADRRLDHVKVLGPSAHALVLRRRNGADYMDLVRAGIKPYQDAQAVHSYPGGLRGHHTIWPSGSAGSTQRSGPTIPSSSPKPVGPPVVPPGHARTARPTPPRTPPRQSWSWPA